MTKKLDVCCCYEWALNMERTMTPGMWGFQLRILATDLMTEGPQIYNIVTVCPF